jgi:predicted transcriptional regulator
MIGLEWRFHSVNKWAMTDDNTTSLSGANRIDPATALSALGNPQRWAIFQMMGDGQELTINELVTKTGRTYNAVHKDMGVLCASGVVDCWVREDKRIGLFHIPAEFRLGGGVVDYGFAQFRLPSSGGRIPKD